MNHLCGLSNLNEKGDSLPKDLTDELPILRAFRQRYESALYHDNDENNSADEEKKDSPAHQPGAPAMLNTTPTYEISQDDLPSSGLRPLDDATLYRYLLADRLGDGTFDEEASYQRLISALQFRKQYKCDVIVQNIISSDIPPKIQKAQRLRVGIWAGVDEESRPVVFERLGQFFSSGNASMMSQEEWMTFYLYFLETHFAKIRESAKKSGRAVDRIVYFGDLQGVVTSILNRKIWKVVPLIKSLVKSVECHYPEVVDHIVLFNVPRVASAFYNFCKGFVDPVTAGKIEVFAGVPYDRFNELISENVIPVEYGGKNGIAYPSTASE
ncbi:hypothetical protein ACHAXR_009148 [Thalassiosira sp. AJA248-18]